MKKNSFSQDWVMDPNPQECEFNEQPGQTAAILKLIKEYFYKIELEKANLYKNITKLLEKNHTIKKS